MRLYLNAESKNNIGYTPDWMKVSYQEDGKELELTLDIQGTIDYDKESLSCRCKGDLVPWVLWDCYEGDETDLSTLTEKEIEATFPNERIADIIENGYDFEIGMYPAEDSDEIFELAEKDVLSDCEGRLEMYLGENNDYEKEFTFTVELNI